jgi:hypothetical protein
LIQLLAHAGEPLKIMVIVGALVIVLMTLLVFIFIASFCGCAR